MGHGDGAKPLTATACLQQLRANIRSVDDVAGKKKRRHIGLRSGICPVCTHVLVLHTPNQVRAGDVLTCHSRRMQPLRAHFWLRESAFRLKGHMKTCANSLRDHLHVIFTQLLISFFITSALRMPYQEAHVKPVSLHYSGSAAAALVGSLDEEPPKKTAGKAYNVYLQVTNASTDNT